MNPLPNLRCTDNRLLIYDYILISFRCICLMAFMILQSIIVIDNYNEFYLSQLRVCKADKYKYFYLLL